MNLHCVVSNLQLDVVLQSSHCVAQLNRVVLVLALLAQVFQSSTYTCGLLLRWLIDFHSAVLPNGWRMRMFWQNYFVVIHTWPNATQIWLLRKWKRKRVNHNIFQLLLCIAEYGSWVWWPIFQSAWVGPKLVSSRIHVSLECSRMFRLWFGDAPHKQPLVHTYSLHGANSIANSQIVWGSANTNAYERDRGTDGNELTAVAQAVTVSSASTPCAFAHNSAPFKQEHRVFT